MLQRTTMGVIALVLSACGGGAKDVGAGSTPTPTTGATNASPKTAETDAEDEGISSAAKKAAAEESLSPTKAPPASSDGLVTLETVQGKPAPDAAKDFPAKKTTDAACVGDIDLTGKSVKDYEDVGAKCGTATGMKPYTKPVTGKLGPSHTRDVYTFTMLGGLCYRFFAVGDDSLANVNIRVETMSGAFLSMDSTKQPIAILDPDAAWCKTHDRAFRFIVETQGKTDGSYVFGVWARPK